MSRGAASKREGEALATPAWLTEIEEPVSLAELEQQTPVLRLDGAATIDAPAARAGRQPAGSSTS